MPHRFLVLSILVWFAGCAPAGTPQRAPDHPRSVQAMSTDVKSDLAKTCDYWDELRAIVAGHNGFQIRWDAYGMRGVNGFEGFWDYAGVEDLKVIKATSDETSSRLCEVAQKITDLSIAQVDPTVALLAKSWALVCERFALLYTELSSRTARFAAHLESQTGSSSEQLERLWELADGLQRGQLTPQEVAQAAKDLPDFEDDVEQRFRKYMEVTWARMAVLEKQAEALSEEGLLIAECIAREFHCQLRDLDILPKNP